MRCKLKLWIRLLSLVAKSCLTLCNSMDCSMPRFPVLHYLLEFALMQSIKSVRLFNHLLLCCPRLHLFSVFPNIRVFSNEFFISGGQSIGASASVLPMNIQSWRREWQTLQYFCLENLMKSMIVWIRLAAFWNFSLFHRLCTFVKPVAWGSCN